MLNKYNEKKTHDLDMAEKVVPIRERTKRNRESMRFETDRTTQTAKQGAFWNCSTFSGVNKRNLD